MESNCLHSDCDGSCKENAHEIIDRLDGFLLFGQEKGDNDIYALTHNMTTVNMLNCITALCETVRILAKEHGTSLDEVMKLATREGGISGEELVHTVLDKLIEEVIPKNKKGMSKSEIERRIKDAFADTDIEVITGSMDGPRGFSMEPPKPNKNQMN